MILLGATVSSALACDERAPLDRVRDRAPAAELPASDVATWGCDQSITGLPKRWPGGDPRWREEAIVVGDFGFFGMADDFYGHRRHRRSDIQVKLPITIEGHTDALVWIPPDERHRAALILADVPRRGPGDSHRLEDGHSGIRFEPCLDREWTAWTAGLALADRRAISVRVKEETAARATTVTLGPWEVELVGPLAD